MFALAFRILAIVIFLLQAVFYHLGGPVSPNDVLALGALGFASFIGSFLF